MIICLHGNEQARRWCPFLNIIFYNIEAMEIPAQCRMCCDKETDWFNAKKNTRRY